MPRLPCLTCHVVAPEVRKMFIRAPQYPISRRSSDIGPNGVENGKVNMTKRKKPVARRPDVQGPFEKAMALGTRVPGTLGYIARRKLKRRQCARMQDTFSQVLAETQAGDLCIDLGANIGSITKRMAMTGADVISFEPDPGAFAALT